ncbi:hypothetical protein BDV18DRAFT_130174 [Aspergillus unguis]
MNCWRLVQPLLSPIRGTQAHAPVASRRSRALCLSYGIFHCAPWGCKDELGIESTGPRYKSTSDGRRIGHFCLAENFIDGSSAADDDSLPSQKPTPFLFSYFQLW